MKKVPDYDITLKVMVSTCKQSFTLVCSIHTRIQQIILQVCKHLDFDRFDTKMQIHGGHYIALKPTSTLLQNNVQNNDTLNATILSTKHKSMNHTQPVILPTKRGVSLHKKESKCYGLTLVCTCVQPRCINFGVEELIPIGFGKCNVCPYRDQKTNPSMVVKEITVENCAWRVRGTHNSREFPAQGDTGFKKIKGKSGIYGALNKEKWSGDVTLTVKDL